jgi:hypothetical protein
VSLPADRDRTYSCTFTNTQRGSKSGYKFNDLNQINGWDSGEPVISGWTVDLWDLSGATPVKVDTTTTGADGKYEFLNLLPGKPFVVCEVLELGWTQTYPADPGNPLPPDRYRCTDLDPAANYGAIGYWFNLNPGENHTDNNFGNWRSLGCGYTWGYWKNHNMYQNAGGAHRDPGWDKIGEDTQFYGNWEDSPTNSNSLTWFEILLIPPKQGNAYLILAHQYVAAWLNINKDANPADPAALGSAMADAEALLAFYSNNNPAYATYPPEIPKGASNLSGDDRAWAISLAGLLDQFNNGLLGPVHCGE